MNNKGFIATSLIYSFFLLLTVLLIGYVAVFLHNKTLLNRVKNEIIDNIYSQGKNTLYDKAKLGDYVVIPMKTLHGTIDNLKWIVIEEADEENNKIKLITEQMLYATSSYYDIDLLNNEYQQFYSLYNKEINYLLMHDMDLIPSALKDKLLNIFPEYLYMDNGVIMGYNYECQNIDKKETCTIKKEVKDINIKPVPVLSARGILYVNSKNIVKSGNGTSSNPYTINHIIMDNLIFYLDARNNMGNSSNIDSNAIIDLSSSYREPILAKVNLDNTYIDLSLKSIETIYNLEDVINSLDGFTIQMYLADNNDVKLSFLGNNLFFNKSKITINSNPPYYLSNADKITIVKINNSLKIYANSVNTHNITNIITKTNNDVLNISGTRLKGILIYNRALTDSEISNNEKLWDGVY